MGRGFAAIYVTKSCKCEDRNKDNWFRDGNLVCCSKCDNQWYTQAKYKKTLKTREEFYGRK
jgi:uncharacterized Zn ribbon protein